MKIYFDTTTWIRPFEDGDNLVNLQGSAVNKILNQNFDIFSSKFQHKQLSYLIRNETILNKKQNYQYARDLCEYYCPNSIEVHTHYKNEANELMQKTRMNHKEDAIHIVTAWIRGADYFITTDTELYDTKKAIIENTLRNMTRPLGFDCKDIEVWDPIVFKQIVGI